MILPQEFNTFDHYFEEVTAFLQRFHWMYEAPNTNLLTCDIFSKAPEEWLEPLLDLTNDELNNVPVGLIKDGWPTSLVKFSQDCKRLTLPVLSHDVSVYKPHKEDTFLEMVPREIWRGMSPKKREEVEIMSSFVHHESKQLGIGKIVDLGSGLGYIDRLLLLRGYQILGIESQDKLVAFATMQKENFFPQKIAKKLVYHNMRITGSLSSEIKKSIVELLLLNQSYVSEKPSGDQDVSENCNKYNWNALISQCDDVVDANTNKVCMIGLHACGDLAATAMKLYLSLPEVSSLILVPCCYHKMALQNNCFSKVITDFSLEEVLCDTDSESCEEAFNNFPLSKNLIKRSYGAKFICRPFLRLANQSTNASWLEWTETDHQQHSFNVLSRAVIELFAQQQGTIFKKCFRRVARKTSVKGRNFLNYIDESLSRCEFVNQKQMTNYIENKDTVRMKLMEMWEEHKRKLKLVEVITALQMCLEPVAESLVVADRACYLLENGTENFKIVKMIESKLSPRGLAYISSKT